MNIDTVKARETVMIERLLTTFKAFYADKKNLEAFEKWLKEHKT